jgi:hypothetical protein
MFSPKRRVRQVPSDDFAGAGIQPPKPGGRSSKAAGRVHAEEVAAGQSKRSKSRDKKGSSGEAPPGYPRGAFHAIWNDPINGKYVSATEYRVHKAVGVATFLLYAVGFGAMIFYATEVHTRFTPTRSTILEA